jgi:uncharacterized protein
MLALLICHDKPGALPLRLENRPAHLEYLAAFGAVELAGPIIGDEGTPIGSMIVIRVETLDEARAFAANDPYAKAGLFDSVTVREWRKVIG